MWKCENYFNTLNSMKIQFTENSFTLRQFWAGVLEQLTSQLGLQGIRLDIWLWVWFLLRILPLKAFPKESPFLPSSSLVLMMAVVPGSFCFASRDLRLLLPLWEDSLRTSHLSSALGLPELELCHLLKEYTLLLRWHLVTLWIWDVME